MTKEQIAYCPEGGESVVVTINKEEIEINKQESNEEYESSYRERNFDAYED
jgi:hypothetical protein